MSNEENVMDLGNITGTSDRFHEITAAANGEAEHVAAIKAAGDLAGSHIAIEHDGRISYRGILIMTETDLGPHLALKFHSWATGSILEIPVRVKVTGRSYQYGLREKALKVKVTFIDPMEFGETPSGYREDIGEGWVF